MKKIFKLILFWLILQSILSTWVWWVATKIPAQPPQINGDLYKGVAHEKNPWLEPWQRWDTPQYQAIAEHGYAAFDTSLFTPPLYPLLMHHLAPLFSDNELASGLFLSSIAFLGCMVMFYFLSLHEFSDEDQAWRTVQYFSLFPTAFFFVAAYSESLFLLNTILCFWFIKKNNWLAGGVFAGLAAFTRLQGALIIVPLMWTAWNTYRYKKDKTSWLAPTIAAIGAASFPLYVWIFLKASPFAIFEAQNTRGGYLTLPGKNILEAVIRIMKGQMVQENITELLFSLFLIVMTIIAWRNLPRVYGIYAVTLTLFFLSRFGSPQPLVSMARYTIEVFPLFFVLAQFGKNNWANRIILYLSWLGLLFFAGQFALWGWVG